MRVVSFGSQFRFNFLSRQFTLTQALFQFLLNDFGVRYQLHGNCFLTAAHTDEDIEAVCSAVCKVLEVLRENDFFHRVQGHDLAGDAVVLPRPRGRGGESSKQGGHGRQLSVTDDIESADSRQALSSSPASAGDPEQMTAQVQRIIAEFLELDAAEIDQDEDLGNFGLDSIMFVKILKLVSADVGHKLPLKAFADVNTIAEFSAQVCTEVAQALASENKAGVLEHKVHSGGESVTAGHAVPIARATKPYPRDDALPQSVDESSPKQNVSAARGQGGPRDIAIVGMSGTFAGAPDIASFWANLTEGRREISEVPVERWSWQEVYSSAVAPGRTQSKWGGFIDGHDFFDPLFFRISPREAKFMDPQERILLMQTYRAIEDSSLNVNQLRGHPIGVFIGYEFTDYAEIVRAGSSDLKDELGDATARPYYLANRLSSVFDFHGPSEAINVNCASSAVSLNRACQSLLHGESEAAIVAGISLNLIAGNYVQAGDLLSPDGSSRVFGQGANGYTKGEGCVVLVLRRLCDALKESNPIYGVIKGCHQSHRGRGNSMSEVCADALSKTITDCHRKAGVLPETVRYIEVDGYSTTNGDQLEFQAVKDALGPASDPVGGKSCALGSLKSNFGHLEPASGLASLAKVALSLKHGQFPPTIGVGEVNEHLDVNDPHHGLYLATDTISLEDLRALSGTPIRAGVNSFADTGAYVHILLEEFSQPEMPSTSPQEQVFVLSARSADTLRDYMGLWIQYLEVNADNPLDRLAYTSQIGRAALKHRFACTANSPADLRCKLEAATAGDFSDNAYIGTVAADHSEVDYVQTAESHALPTDIARLWVSGAEVDWQAMHGERPPVPLHGLPTYPFALRQFWITPAGEQADSVTIKDDLEQPVPQRAEPADKWASEVVVSVSEISSDARLIEIMRDVRSIVDEFLELGPDEEIDEHANFADIGLTSLAIVEFVDHINERFSLALPETTAFDFPNIGSLAAHIVESSDSTIPIADITATEIEPIQLHSLQS